MRDFFRSSLSNDRFSNVRSRWNAIEALLPPPTNDPTPLTILADAVGDLLDDITIDKMVDDFTEMAGRIRLGPGKDLLGLRKRKTNKFITKHLLYVFDFIDIQQTA